MNNGRIKVLPDDVKNRISAGEVVEGPSSVIKELVENSLDAGADRIDVHVLQSGMKKIMVSDNGCGIMRDDVALAVMDHATSKISDVHDIEGIDTYGFRGEALACIAAVSDLTVLTRHVSEATGTRLFSSASLPGKTEISDYAGPVGTTVIVENLFYTVPARKKFLKAPQTELRYGRQVLLNAAQASPGVSFTFNTDQKRRQNLPAADSLEERLRQIYGNETSDSCIFEELTDLQAGICGMLSKPDFLLPSRRMQQLFINGRPVDYRYLSFLLSRAYEAVAPRGKYPAAVLFLTIDPSLVDVNIHPAKREVKLFDSRYVDSLILHLAEKVLNRSHNINEKYIHPVTAPEMSDDTMEVQEKPDQTLTVSSEYSSSQKASSPVSFRKTEDQGTLFRTSGSPAPVRELRDLYINMTSQRDWSVLGQLFKTYILAEKGDELYIIDFHAAHERFLYDELRQRGIPREKQELLFPVMAELSMDDCSLVTENLELFSEIGFDMDLFSDNTITIRSVPAVLGKVDEKAFLSEAVDCIREDRRSDRIYDSIAATAACHSANRAGDLLTDMEAELLTEKVFSGKHELRCPHGRPFVHIIKKTDLEKIFKRKL